MSWLFVACAFFLLVALSPLIEAYKIYLIKLMSGSIESIEPNLVPPEQLDLLASAEKFYAELGFENQAYVVRGPVINGNDWGFYGIVFHHQNTNTWALVFTEPSGHEFFPWQCFFMTNVGDKIFTTVNGESNIGDLSKLGFVVNDPMVSSMSEQWQFHQHNLKNSIDTTIHKKDLAEILKAFETVYFQGLVDTGLLVPYNEGYRYTFKDSRNVLKLNSHVNETLRNQQKQKNNTVSELADKSAYVQREVVAYNSFRKVKESNRASLTGKTILLLASIILFGVSFGINLSWSTLLSLIIVLFIHEAGHLFGMWVFGYKDLKMLFIPFLGALASGQKKHVNTWQESVILLLGPMSGYVLGIAILYINLTQELPEWLVEYATISIALNVINLFPFMPLDGGKVVSLALFNRRPSLELLLMMLSVFLFLYIGVFWDEWVLMILGILLLLGLPSLRREIRLSRHLLRKKLHEKPFEIKSLIEELHNHTLWKDIAMSNKWPLIDSLSYRIQHANVAISVRVLIFMMWLVVIFLPIYVALPSGSMLKLLKMLGLEF